MDVLPFDSQVPHDSFNMEGYELAFEDFVTIEVLDMLGHSLFVKVAGPAAFVTMKTIAYSERGAASARDLQDIWFVLKNYGTLNSRIDSYVEATERDPEITLDEMGAFLVGRAMRAIKSFPSVTKAIGLLNNLFTDVDAPGVTTLVHFVGGFSNTDEEVEMKAEGMLKLFKALLIGFTES